MRDIGLGADVDKIVIGLWISDSRVGELNALGVLDGGDGDVTSSCATREKYDMRKRIFRASTAMRPTHRVVKTSIHPESSTGSRFRDLASVSTSDRILHGHCAKLSVR